MTTGDGQPGDLRVAVLGAGILGSAVSRKLVAAGLHTTVWGILPSATAPLADAGATIAASPAEAAGDAEVVITMLPTAGAVQLGDLRRRRGHLFAPGAVWAQMSTIGGAATAEIASRLDRLRPDVLFVDAPVSGADTLAETGELLILARPARRRAGSQPGILGHLPQNRVVDKGGSISLTKCEGAPVVPTR